MASMNTPTIALQDDQLCETGDAGTPCVVLDIPRAAAVTRACALTPNGEHPVLVVAAALARLSIAWRALLVLHEPDDRAGAPNAQAGAAPVASAVRSGWSPTST